MASKNQPEPGGLVGVNSKRRLAHPNPMTQLQQPFSIQRQRHKAQCFTEPALQLDLMLIPGGKFLMGSPPDEIDRALSESPQHEVTVAPFLMGRYPVTQAQWRAIALRRDFQVNLPLEPDPSRFKGDDHPVERITWHQAVEFCDRLSRLSRHPYRLPSEAEWEYACRAGTTTPFHLGETITTDLANYCGQDSKEYGWLGSYGQGPTGLYRETTTPVNHFQPLANAFGLSDMHGNVWEWCLDDWHDNYQGDPPTDGSAWLSRERNSIKVLRGGSWSYDPSRCRSACRDDYDPEDRHNSIGFRVVSEARGL